MSRSHGSSKSELKGTRRDFTAEFKREAVRLMNEKRAAGVKLAQIARELDVPGDLLRNWARQLGQWDVAGAREAEKSPEQELQRLRRENEVLRQERDFLKKATAFFAKESR